MPDRPADPRTYAPAQNDVLRRLRELERLNLLLPEGTDPLQTFEDGHPMGDTRFLDFGSGIQSTLIGNDFVRISADAGEMVFDALVDNSLVASEPNQRKFVGIGEALTYLSTTVGLASVAVFVRATSTNYVETANWGTPSKVFLFGGRGDYGDTSSPSITDPNVQWDWNGFRPTSAAILHIENFQQIEPKAGASGGAFTTAPITLLTARNTYFIFSHTGGTAYFCSSAYFEMCAFNFTPGSGTTQQNICSSSGTFVQCDGQQSPGASGTLTVVPAALQLLMIGCRWNAIDAGTHFLTLPVHANIDLTYAKNRQPTSAPQGRVTINVASASRTKITLHQETTSGDYGVSATSSFLELALYGHCAVATITGTHTSVIIDASIATLDVRGPATVKSLVASTQSYTLRGTGISALISGVILGGGSAGVIQFVGADHNDVVAALDGTGATGTKKPYTFDATSDNNVLLLTGASTFPAAGTDAGTGNRVLPEAVLTAGHVIEDEGVALAQQPNLNFVGAGVTVTDSTPDTIVTIPGGGHTIEDEGVPLAQQTAMNFVGAGVTATDAGGKTVVTIPGGGGGSGDEPSVADWISL